MPHLLVKDSQRIAKANVLVVENVEIIALHLRDVDIRLDGDVSKAKDGA